MNQRFLDLTIKATDDVLATGSILGSDEFNHMFVQKYSEMLLQECLDICEKGAETQTTSQGAAILIKQRFGII
jgi:hypothetical protein